MFTKEETTNIPHFEERQVQDYQETVNITEEGVKKKLVKLNASKLAGPDDHHQGVLKEVQDQVVQHQKMISQNHWRKGIYHRIGGKLMSPKYLRKARNPMLPTTNQ